MHVSHTSSASGPRATLSDFVTGIILKGMKKCLAVVLILLSLNKY